MEKKYLLLFSFVILGMVYIGYSDPIQYSAPSKGQVSSVIAGTNVTVTPSNGQGDVTVNSNVGLPLPAGASNYWVKNDTGSFVGNYNSTATFSQTSSTNGTFQNLAIDSITVSGSSITLGPNTLVLQSTPLVAGNYLYVESVTGKIAQIKTSVITPGGAAASTGLTTETTIQYCLCGGPGEVFSSTIPFKLAKPFATGNSSYTIINAVAISLTLSTHPITFGVGISTEINANANFPAIRSGSFTVEANQMYGTSFTNFDSTSTTSLNAYQKMSLFISSVTAGADLATGLWGVQFELKKRSN